MSRLLTTPSMSNVANGRGRMPLAYCFDPAFEVERHLVNASCPTSLTRHLQLLIILRGDPSYVNYTGEDFLHCAVRSRDEGVLKPLFSWAEGSLPHRLGLFITRKGRPNSWSPFRRAVYAEDVQVFRRLWTCLAPEDRATALGEKSTEVCT